MKNQFTRNKRNLYSKSLLLGIGFLLATAPAFAAPSAAVVAKTNEQVKIADEAMGNGFTAKAAKAYTEAWDLMPEREDVGLKAALLWSDRLNNPAEAARIVNYIVAHPQDPKLGEAARSILELVQPGLQKIYDEQLKKGKVLFADKKDEAAIAFTAARQAQPNRKEPLLYLARLRADQKDLGGAVAFLTATLKTDPVTIDEVLSQPELSALTGEKPLVDFLNDAFGDAVVTKKLSAYAMMKEADALVHDKKYGEAEAIYRKAILTDPENAEFHYQFAERQWRSNDAGATSEFREAVRLDPTNAEYHSTLGANLGYQNLDAESEAQYRQAIKMDPRYYDMFGSNLFYREKYEQALAVFQEAIQVDKNLDVYLTMAFTLQHLKRAEEAEIAFRQSAQLRIEEGRNKSAASCYRDLGDSQRRRGKTDEAIESYRMAVKVFPDSSSYWDLGFQLKIAKRWVEAEAAFRESVRLTPEYADGWQYLGEVLMQQNKFSEAQKAYEELVKLKPDNEDYKKSLEKAIAAQK